MFYGTLANLSHIVLTRFFSVICVYRRQAVLCILAESCDEANYKKLVTALCNEHQIPLLHVDSHKKLGEWSGLCKIDKEGKPRKICGCSCVVIKVRELNNVMKDTIVKVYLSFTGLWRGNSSP